MKPRRYYMIWRKGSVALAAKGTAEECAEALGYSCLSSFYAAVSRNKSGFHKKYDLTAQGLGGDDEEEFF